MKKYRQSVRSAVCCFTVNIPLFFHHCIHFRSRSRPGFYGSGSGSGSEQIVSAAPAPAPSKSFRRLRLRLRANRFGGSGSGSDQNVSAPAAPAPAPAPHPWLHHFDMTRSQSIYPSACFASRCRHAPSTLRSRFGGPFSRRVAHSYRPLLVVPCIASVGTSRRVPTHGYRGRHTAL